jgi:hypothetical protein
MPHAVTGMQKVVVLKGGSEATVRIAKADLVPTEHNLRDKYEDFAALERTCEQFMAEVNTRPHRVTRRPPIEMLGARSMSGCTGCPSSRTPCVSVRRGRSTGSR